MDGTGRLASCSWILLFMHLFLLMFVDGNGVGISEETMIFFTPNDDLKIGKKMPIYFHRKDLSTNSPRFLPREEVDKIPFSLKQLPTLLRFFSFSPGSPPATAVENTLSHCEMEPIIGEFKLCATSLESMLDFVNAALGVGYRFKFLSTTHRSNGVGLSFQNYTFVGTPKETAVTKYVACHSVPYPYAVFHCHQLEGGSKVMEIELEGDDGERVAALANCHLDTSHFSPDHVVFKILKIQPGMVPVCHFLPAGDLLWIPVSATATV